MSLSLSLFVNQKMRKFHFKNAQNSLFLYSNHHGICTTNKHTKREGNLKKGKTRRNEGRTKGASQRKKMKFGGKTNKIFFFYWPTHYYYCYQPKNGLYDHILTKQDKSWGGKKKFWSFFSSSRCTRTSQAKKNICYRFPSFNNERKKNTT